MTSDILRQLLANSNRGVTPPPVLYHYTSLAGFKGIVESKELWATGIRYLNDAREFLEAMARLDSVLVERLRANPDKGPVHEFLDEVRMHRVTLSRMNLCVFSLTEHGDLLSQWRGYCSPGDGYSVGFDTGQLLTLVKPLSFTLERCIYDLAAQEREVSNLLGTYLQQIVARSDDDDDKSTADILPFLSDFLSLAPRIKNSAFAQEDEWRLVSPVTSLTDARMCYRIGRSMLMPHFVIPIEPLPIVSVIVGPTPHRELAKEAAQGFLSKNGLKSEVTISAVPFRTH